MSAIAPTAVLPDHHVDPHVTLSGAAVILAPCSRHLVLVYATRGRLTPIPMPGHVYFRRAEVEALRDRLAAERKASRRSQR
jgi:hypothetical protein